MNLRNTLVAAMTLCLLSTLTMAAGIGPTSTSRSALKPAQWPLPKIRNIDRASFHVSPSETHVFMVQQDVTKLAGITKLDITCWMLETPTGRIVDFANPTGDKSQAMPMIVLGIEMSPNGKAGVMRIVPVKGQGMYLFPVDFTGEKQMGKPLTRGAAIGTHWTSDNRLLFSSHDEMGRVGPVKSYNPVDKSISDLNFNGLLIDASADGKVLACLTNPKAPGKFTSLADKNAGITILNGIGLVLSSLGTINQAGPEAIVSERGKYVAFHSTGQQMVGPGEPSPKTHTQSTLMTTGA